MNFNTGIVLFNQNTFGGAERRFTNLFKYLFKICGENYYYFVNCHLFKQLEIHFDDLPYENIIVIDNHMKKAARKPGIENTGEPKLHSETLEDTMDIHSKASYARKVYWYYKNMLRQYLLFREIEKNRKKFNIKVFIGVFGGVLPLVFYLKKRRRKAAVIFSDMDSWFCEVHKEMKKLWYRKYYSFNYALENCDIIDFLSPYIHKGIKARGVKLIDENTSIADSCFADYSLCKVEEKKDLEIAFCARLEPDKNPLLYLEAASIILNKYPDVKFHLIGEGSLANCASHFIKTKNLLNKILFTYHKNPPEIFARTSVFISIQTTNNYPSQSVLEAMACGNAIIASDVGDTRLFINNTNGILIDLNLNNLKVAIEDLITNREKTNQLGLNAREFVLKNHTIEKSLSYYQGLFERAHSKILENEK